MSHFYGTLDGQAGRATRCGSKSSGLQSASASWKGAIQVRLYHENGKDHFVVEQIPWQGSGIKEVIATGVLGETSKQETKPNA